MSKAIYEAMKFLIEQLWEEEKRTAEVQKIAIERGISGRTLERARMKVGVKPRRNGTIRLMRLPPESREKAIETLKQMKEKAGIFEIQKKITKQIQQYEVSTDWVLITGTTNDGSERNGGTAPQGDTVRIKAGGYEIEAGSGFPVEKLVEVLRAVGGGESK